MKLEDLLQALRSVDAASDARFAAIELAGISADSRMIKPGDLFVAVTGAKDDGLRFVDQAVASGAVAIMAPTSASATTTPATLASPRNHHMVLRLAILVM